MKHTLCVIALTVLLTTNLIQAACLYLAYTGRVTFAEQDYVKTMMEGKR